MPQIIGPRNSRMCASTHKLILEEKERLPVAKYVAALAEQAFEDLATAQRLDTSDLDVYWDRAELWDKAGNFAEAIGDYTRIIQNHPLEADALVFRANDLTVLGRYEDALRDFDTA